MIVNQGILRIVVVVPIRISLDFDLFERIVVEEGVFLIHVELMSEWKQKRFAVVMIRDSLFMQKFPFITILVNTVVMEVALVLLGLHNAFVWTQNCRGLTVKVIELILG